MATDSAGQLPQFSSYDLPAQFFLFGIYNRTPTTEDDPHIFTDDSSIGKKLGVALIGSHAMQNVVNSCISSVSWDENSYYFFDLVIDHYDYANYDVDKELSLCVGQAKISLTITRTGNNQYQVSFTVYDSYTFENWKITKSDGFAKFTNNLGYVVSKTGLINQYYWQYSSSFNISSSWGGCRGGKTNRGQLYVK